MAAKKAKSVDPAKKKPTRAAARSTVDELLAGLDHPRKAEIEIVRRLILGADARIREGVKWNAPSFFIEEHFATFKLMPKETVQVVFHTGAKVKPDAKAVQVDDPAGLLKWAAKDRCIVTLRDREDVETKQRALIMIIKQWIEQTSP